MDAVALQVVNKHALEAKLSQLKAEFLNKGVQPVDPADFSIGRFAKLSLEEQQAILANISSYLQILSEETHHRERRDYEIDRLKSALRKFKLKLKDEEFFSKIDEHDFIELYNNQNIQIYRSVKFFSLCSYNLLDLSVNSWDELYEKPIRVMSRIIEEIEESKRELLTVSSGIGSFVQREKFTYASAAVLRTFLVNLRYLTPVINEETGETAGFLCTFTADVLAEGSTKFGVL